MKWLQVLIFLAGRVIVVRTREDLQICILILYPCTLHIFGLGRDWIACASVSDSVFQQGEDSNLS